MIRVCQLRAVGEGFPLPPNVRASRWICGEYSVDLDEPSPDAGAKDAAPAP